VFQVSLPLDDVVPGVRVAARLGALL
jgi:hypothetical protein